MSMPGRWGLAFPRPDGLTLAIVAIALLGAGLVLAREATYGVALHLDSAEYIGTARALLAGDGFVRLNGHVYDAWAPLYPVLLAAASFGAFDPLDVAGPLNVIAFGLTICVAGRWMRLRLASRFLVAWVCLAVALAVPLSRVASAALSEMPFILFATLALSHADAFLRDGKRPAFMWAVAFTALACLTRYIGVALIPAVAAMLLLRGAPLGARVKPVGAYASLSAFPLALWALGTGLLTGTPGGARSGETTSVPETLDLALEILSGWLLLDTPPERLQIAVSTLTVALLLLLALLAFRLFRAGGMDRGGTASLLVLFVTAYVAALAATSAFSWVSGWSRLYAPLYVPLVVLAAVVCDRFIRFPEGRWWRRGSVPFPLLSGALLLVMSIWIAYQVPGLAREMRREHPLDADVAARWADAAILQPLRELPLGETPLSNAPDLLRAHLDARGDYRMLDREYAAAVASIEAAPPGTHVVWFNLRAGNLRFGYGAPEIRGLSGLEMVIERRHGAVFRVTGDGANDWRDLARSLTNATPVASSFFSVYLINGALLYDRSPCSRADMRAPGFLHVIPADTGDLPADRRAYGFDNLDFSFSRSGARFDGRCMARAELPAYDVARVRTGQFNNAGVRWQVEIPLGELR